MFSLPIDKQTWINDSSWYNDTKSTIFIMIKSRYKKPNFYFTVCGRADFKNTLIDDMYILHAENFNDSFDNRIDLYDKVRCIIAMIVSDLRIQAEKIFIAGPTGIINCKGNFDKSPEEEYFLNNYNTSFSAKYVDFLNKMNIALYMQDVIEKCIADKKNNSSDILFLSEIESYIEPSPFGCTRMMKVIRKIKYGDMQLKDDEINNITENKILTLCPVVIEKYNLHSKRYIQKYIDALDSYLIEYENAR